MFGLRRFTLVVSVGNHEDSAALVGSSEIACRDRKRKARIAELFQVTDDKVDPQRSAAADVFDHNPSGPELSHETSELTPQARALSNKARATARAGDILAGEPARDEIHANKLGCAEGFDIVEARDLGPVPLKDSTAKRIDLDLPEYRTEARAFKAEFQTPYIPENNDPIVITGAPPFFARKRPDYERFRRTCDGKRHRAAYSH